MDSLNKFKYMFAYFKKYQEYKRSIVIGIATSIALLTLSLLPFYVSVAYHDTQRMVSTVIVAFALCVSICFTRVNRQTMCFLGQVYVWGMFAVYMSPIPLWSMIEFGLLFSVVLLGMTLMPKLQKRHLKYLTILITAIHGFYAAHNLTDYALTLVLSREFAPNSLSSGFSNVRFYGQFLVWTMPLMFGALVANQKLPYRNVILVILMFDWAFELLTLTRAFLVAMAFTLPVVWWMARSYWLQYAKCFFLTVAGGVAIYVLMLYVIPGLLGIDISYALKFSSGRDMLNSSGRAQLWLEAWQLMLINPWLGAGPMTTALGSVSRISAHPHNYILQLLAEWGVPFTLLLVGGAVYGSIKLKRLIQKSSTESQLLAVPIAASLSAGAVAGLFDGLLVMPVSLVYMTLVLACCAGLWRNLTPEVERRKFPWWSVPFLISPAIFVAVFAVMNWPHWSTGTTIPKPMSGYGYELKPNLNPRFWLTGQIDIVKK